MQVAGRLANWVSSRQNESLSQFAQANGAVATPDAVDAEVTAATAAASAAVNVDPTMSIRNFFHYPAMEVAAVLNTSVTVASGMCARALTMELLPNSRALHSEGLIDLARVRSITSGLLHAPLSMYRILDNEIAKKARQLTPKKLEAYVRLRVERHQSATLTARHTSRCESPPNLRDAQCLGYQRSHCGPSPQRGAHQWPDARWAAIKIVQQLPR